MGPEVRSFEGEVTVHRGVPIAEEVPPNKAGQVPLTPEESRDKINWAFELGVKELQADLERDMLALENEADSRWADAVEPKEVARRKLEDAYHENILKLEAARDAALKTEEERGQH